MPELAAAVGAGGKTWRAYSAPSARQSASRQCARPIGWGPWQNAKAGGRTNADDLHSDKNRLGKENSLTEKGAMVNGRGTT